MQYDDSQSDTQNVLFFLTRLANPFSHTLPLFFPCLVLYGLKVTSPGTVDPSCCRRNTIDIAPLLLPLFSKPLPVQIRSELWLHSWFKLQRLNRKPVHLPEYQPRGWGIKDVKTLNICLLQANVVNGSLPVCRGKASSSNPNRNPGLWRSRLLLLVTQIWCQNRHPLWKLHAQGYVRLGVRGRRVAWD